MQRQEIAAAIVWTKHPKRSFHLIEKNFSLGDFYLKELSEKLKPIPRKKKKSLSLEELDPSNWSTKGSGECKVSFLSLKISFVVEVLVFL